LAWTKESENDIFHLPSLNDDHRSVTDIKLGDKVRIFGKIQCLSIEENGKAIREIHASLVEKVEISGSIGVEARHWQICSDLEVDMVQDPTRFNSLSSRGPTWISNC